MRETIGPEDETDTSANTPLAVNPVDDGDDETYTDPVDEGFEDGGDEDDD